MLFVDWTQHPIGHGGFHSGRAYGDNNFQFNWVFDCGARKSAKFDTFLKEWTTVNTRSVDWLFISHFDTDHVSGLETLMARTRIQNVMVPYVNKQELAFQLLYEIARGNLNRAFFELTADPAAFFLERGADQVTFLRGRDPDDEPAAAGEAPDGGEDSGWSQRITPTPTPLTTPRMSRQTNSTSTPVQEAKSGCKITVKHKGEALYFIPYTAPLPKQTQQTLVTDLQRAVMSTSRGPVGRPGLGNLALDIGYHARTAPGRAALRKIFQSHIGSSNRSSLSLLSLPSGAPERSFVHVACDWPGIHNVAVGAGWLNTGDAELLATADLTAWEHVYKPYLDRICVLALPHHGSDANSNLSLQKLCPNALLVAHVKAGSKKTPRIQNRGLG